jgi:hypothetical protein
MKTIIFLLVIRFLTNDPAVVGTFGGRTPCAPQLTDLHNISPNRCNRVKLRLTLYQKRDANSPATFHLLMIYVGNDDNQYVKTGKWEVVKDPGFQSAELVYNQSGGLIYKLEPEGSAVPLFLLEGDDNILFILDNNMKPLVGNADNSYTLNRIMK